MSAAKLLGAQLAYPWGQGGDVLGGLTKRELFAVKALQGLAGVPCPGGHTDETVRSDVETAVVLADALLAELAKDGDA